MWYFSVRNSSPLWREQCKEFCWVKMKSVLPSHMLVQPRAQGSAALNAAQACFPPGKWPCSEFWGMMLQRRSPGLTLLPQLFSDCCMLWALLGKSQCASFPAWKLLLHKLLAALLCFWAPVWQGNHRMVWVSRKLKDHLVPAPLMWA